MPQFTISRFFPEKIFETVLKVALNVKICINKRRYEQVPPAVLPWRWGWFPTEDLKSLLIITDYQWFNNSCEKYFAKSLSISKRTIIFAS